MPPSQGALLQTHINIFSKQKIFKKKTFFNYIFLFEFQILND